MRPRRNQELHENGLYQLVQGDLLSWPIAGDRYVHLIYTHVDRHRLAGWFIGRDHKVTEHSWVCSRPGEEDQVRFVRPFLGLLVPVGPYWYKLSPDFLGCSRL